MAKIYSIKLKVLFNTKINLKNSKNELFEKRNIPIFYGVIPPKLNQIKNSKNLLLPPTSNNDH